MRTDVIISLAVVVVFILIMALAGFSLSFKVGHSKTTENDVLNVCPPGTELGKDLGKDWYEMKYENTKFLIHYTKDDENEFQILELK